MFSAADGPEIDDECLNRVFPVWDKHSDKIGSVARTEMPRSESFGAFVFLRDKLRLAFAVISVPLRRDWCRVLCAVCCVLCVVCRVRRRTAFAGFCVLSLSFLLVLVYICVHGLSVVVRLGIQKSPFDGL